MGWGDGGWAPYVPVAERRKRAQRVVAKLAKAGHALAPIIIEGRTIANTFWGRAWCDNMESYRDYESRLPRGRSYVRQGSVVDLQVTPGRVTAMVSGSELYRVTISVTETAQTQWKAICQDCAGSIDSLVELLQGRLSNSVMERLCRQQGGLFPRPSDIRFTCTCPDHASMCKHVAATFYGVGARLDHQPELLFRLRAVDEAGLIAGIDQALPASRPSRKIGNRLETDDAFALFGLEAAPAAETPSAPPVRQRAKRARASATAVKAAAPKRSSAKAPAHKPEPQPAGLRAVRRPKDAAKNKTDTPRTKRGSGPKPVKWW